ncbi:MAG: lytic transglycosylase domain-containing protein [Pseudomonadota bacterium]
MTYGQRITVFAALAAGVIVFCSLTARADIYRYIDSNGVLHFTNVPTSSQYKLYIREKSASSGFRVPGGSRRFDSSIHKASRATGLDFALIKAVIATESGFNPEAVSAKGASGLMQIMPFNFIHLNVIDPFDPVQNIMGGSLYLKQLMDRYQNRLPMVLAAYNAGPDAVDVHNGIPPYPETIDYVHKVMRLYNAYKH